jgi:hypothetical protein
MDVTQWSTAVLYEVRDKVKAELDRRFPTEKVLEQSAELACEGGDGVTPPTWHPAQLDD